MRMEGWARLLDAGDGLLSNEKFSSCPSFEQIPPTLPKPDLEASREKL